MLILLIISSLVAFSSAQCSFRNGDITAKWQVSNGEIIIEIINKNLGNNQWTGVGFGSSMRDQDVVLFMIKNNRASMVTGYTNDYAPPTLDSTPSVNAELIQYNSNTLTGRFSRPLGASGPRNVDLSQCQTWNFGSGALQPDGSIGSFSLPSQTQVCPQQCTSSPGFAQRDVATDPIPIAAVYNNRQSSRFNGLYPGQPGQY